MPPIPPVFLGVDVGTGGVRSIAVNDRGEVLGAASVDLRRPREDMAPGYHEQEAETWWEAACEAVGRIMERLGSLNIPADAVRGVAIDGTSGTLLALDRAGCPLRAALMYNDPRGAEQAERINALAADFVERHGYSFNSSFAAAKILWLRDNEPGTFDRAGCFVHQADYVAFRLTGGLTATDYNNALKTGYDLVEERWPGWLASELGLEDRLPQVVAPATPIGCVSPAGAKVTGLSAGTTVVAGTTDGVAACLASGVSGPGQYNTSLGTTLVFKGFNDTIAKAPGGLVYSHKLPAGRWLPGAASNTGAEWTRRWFAGADLALMDGQAAELVLSAPVAYPLARRGERFPFVNRGAEGFFVSEPRSVRERFAACLLGTALVERLAYQVLERVTGIPVGAVYTTGGASRSEIWNQCRADVSGCVVHRPRCAESAFGAAVLAASGVMDEPLEAAVRRMVHIEKSYFPETRHAALYQERFEEFGNELRKRGYL
ncbi:MAG: FGGY-family carbohydrate kinase [Thermoguttaceae bacterium]